MTIIEIATFILLVLVTLLGTWRLVRRQKLSELKAGRDPHSATFASAAASTLLALKFDPLIDSHSVLFLPVGDGLYLERTTAAKARAWRRALGRWLARGATIHVLVTIPNARAREAWAKFGRDYTAFHYHEFDRQQATPELAKEIARLDTYHPILLAGTAGPGAPQAMWIEQYHPLDSPYAYAVQYVAPAEARTDDRFGIFLAVYRRLIEAAHAHSGEIAHSMRDAA